VGAASLAVTWWLSVPLAAGLGAVAALAGLGYVLAATRGHVDPETATLGLRAREFDLSPVAGYRTRRIGPLALVTLSVPSRPGRFGGVPPRFTVPSDRLVDVTTALEAVVDANEEQDAAGRDPNPVVRGVALALALLFVGAGVGGVVLVGAGVGWYVAALCWLFAVVFLYVAREG
jgi:fatty acid desaturase